MQVFSSALRGADRPCAPSDCQLCRGTLKFHFHSSYERYASASGNAKVRVERFRCPRCGLIIGVIPPGMFPYRCVGVEAFQNWMDAQCQSPSQSLAEQGPRPPPAPRELGCLQRASRALRRRIPALLRLLGQQMPLLGQEDLCGFWAALRSIAALPELLLHLAEKFHTSLLGDYRSLQSPCKRELGSL